MSEKKTTGGTFKKNTFWLLTTHIYTILVGVFVGPLTARALGPSSYGDLVYAENVVSIFAVIASLGMDNYIIAEISAHPDRDDQTIGTALGLRLISGVIGALASIGVIFILKPDNQIIRLCTALESIQIILLVYTVFSYWIQAKMISQYLSLASLLSLSAASLWKIYLYANNPDIYLFSITGSIRYGVFLIVLTAIFYHLNPGIHLHYDPKLARYFLSRSWQFILASMGSLVYSKIDQLMVGSMIDSESLAYYNVAVTLMNYWNMVPTSFFTSAQPLIISMREKDHKQYLRMYQELLLGIFLLGIAAIVGALFLAEPVILFLYKSSYALSVPLFYILIIASLFSMLGSARMIWIVAEHYEKYSKYFVYTGAVADICLNYVLIHAFGVTGAAWATVLTEVIVFFIAPLFFKETRISNHYFFTCFSTWGDLKKTLSSSLKRKRQ
jgi:O-antigen/teichoic acid export membrane protein